MASSVLTYDAFVCKQCGVCCKNQKAVLLTIYDIFRASKELGMSPNGFFKKYCTRSAKFNSDGLKRFYLKAQGGCPFRIDNQCSIQAVKPVACARNPFYYMEASLAALKVFGTTEDECCINELPYDTMAKGDNERLIDMDILVKATDEYIEKHGRFDEKNATLYYEKSLTDLKDPKLRASTYNTFLEQSVAREEKCRTDPYFMGSANMYLSGFYDKFKQVAKAAGDNGNVLAIEPSALGTIDNVMTVILPEKDYGRAKEALASRENAIVRADPAMHNGREYDIITIEADTNIKVIFYYHIEPNDKRELRHGPDETAIDLKGEKGGTFAFRGRDASGLLN